MSDVFSGLESLGLTGLSKVKIYEEEKPEPAKESAKESVVAPVVQEVDFLFDKKMLCPVCNQEFKAKTVKTGKPRLVGADSDLRPKYSGIDSIKYDAIVCPNCGYAALSRFFSYMTGAQAKLIKENVTSSFKGFTEKGDTYSYEEAIKRHKLALYNSIIKKSKNSERAYTCLKIAWLFRGMRENLPADTKDAAKVKEQCSKSELEMIASAFEGFTVSRSKEDFPICGMDECTFDYLLADLALKLGKYDIADKYASSVIVARTANTKLKERARSLRDIIKKNKSDENGK